MSDEKPRPETPGLFSFYVMIPDDVCLGLKKRFAHIHPLIFHRSWEHAKTAGELFDILDTIPTEYPLIWDDQQRRWAKTDDLYRSRAYVESRKRAN